MRLTEFPSEWNEEISGYKSAQDKWPPAGTYNVTIEDCYAERVKDRYEVIRYRLRVFGGPLDRELLTHTAWLTNPQKKDFAWGELIALGLEPQNWNGVPLLLETLVGKQCRVSVQHNGDYVNYRIMGLLPEAAEGDLVHEPTPF